MNKLKLYISIPIFIFMMIMPLLASYYQSGMRLFMHKRYDEAKVQLEKAVEANPSDGNAYYFLGETVRTLGDLDRATEYYQKAVDGNISRKFLKMAYWNLIVLTEKRGNYNELVKSLKIFWRKTGDGGAKNKVEKLINKSIWSDNAEAVEKYNRGMRLKKNTPEEADSNFREAITLDSRFLAPRFEIGLIHYRKGELPGAVNNFREIVSRVPFYGDVHFLLGNIYYNQGEYGYAIEHLSRAIDFSLVGKDSEYDMYLKRGGAYFKRSEYQKAGEDISMASRLKPGEMDPLLLLAAIRIKQENYDEALSSLSAIEKRKPADPNVLLQLGSIYYRKNDGRYVGYFERLYDVLSSEGTYSPQGYSRAMELLAKSHYEKLRLEQAKRVIDFIPEERWDTALRLTAARTAYGLKNYENAVKHFEKVHLRSDDSAYLAAAYTKTGRSDRAKSLVERYYYDDDFMKLARKHSELKRLIGDVEKDRKKREPAPKEQPGEPSKEQPEAKTDVDARAPVDTDASK